MTTPKTARDQNRGPRPTVVCLCGSNRFLHEMAEVSRTLTPAGRVVLAPIAFEDPLSRVQRAALGELHLRKIDLADEVLVINPNKYIGESTRREITYAESHGKPVSYLSEVSQ
ncbi:hypothetical protein LP422_17480 [Janibacter limosus]|uniref:Uncharacterized protein n=1 Tax=Janibacter limosus TaxID=53458 RepID=A0AC61U3A1_9MICO|nr:hypothetical protein [Janibacter limosus]UUZ44262.1 hypothetical protein LP422_17480 [Janibacter limosus]